MENHGPLSLSVDTIDLLIKVTELLEAVQSRGIAHLDIKPENILVQKVNGCWDAKLIDFGSARQVGPGGQCLEARQDWEPRDTLHQR